MTTVNLLNTPVSEWKEILAEAVLHELRGTGHVTLALDDARPGVSALLGCTIGWSDRLLLRHGSGVGRANLPADLNVTNPGPGWKLDFTAQSPNHTVSCVWLDLTGDLPSPPSSIDAVAECEGFRMSVYVTPVPSDQPADHASMLQAAVAAINRLERQVMKGSPMVVCLAAPPIVAYTIGVLMAGFGRFPMTKYVHKDQHSGELVLAGQRP